MMQSKLIRNLIKVLLVLIIAIRIISYTIDLAHNLPTVHTASDHSCPGFYYQGHNSLPSEFVNKMRNALITCVPNSSDSKPYVLCAYLAQDGSIVTIHPSFNVSQQIKIDANFATSIQHVIDGIKKNCSPFDFLPKDYYDSWKNLELTVAPK